MVVCMCICCCHHSCSVSSGDAQTMRQLLLEDEGCAAFVGRVSIGPWSASKASRHRGPEGEMIRGQNRLAQCDCRGSGQRTMRTSPVCHDAFPRVGKKGRIYVAYYDNHIVLLGHHQSAMMRFLVCTSLHMHTHNPYAYTPLHMHTHNPYACTPHSICTHTTPV